MASRELVYRITLSTSDAKRQARNIRSVLEAELRTIQVGKLDITSIQAAVSQAHQLRLEFEQAAVAAQRAGNAASSVRVPSAPTPAAPGISAGGGALASLAGGAAAFLTIQTAQAVANYVTESAKLDTQIRRTEAAFEFLAGGAAQAEARLIAIQRASNGTIDRMGAMEAANQIAALGLAKTAKEFEDLARAAKVVSTYSAQIKSFDDALAQLGLFSASASFARADQLLINATELKDRMRELKEEDSSLTDQQAKLKASVELLNQSFGPMLDNTVAQASGVERLTVAWSELMNQKSGISAFFDSVIGGIADLVDETSVVAGFGSNRAILEVTKANAEAAKAAAAAFFAPAGAERNAKGFEYTAQLLEKLTKGIEDGVPTALEYRQQVEAIAVAADRFGVVTDDQLRRLMDIDSAYKSAVISAKNYNDVVGNPDQARQTAILEQQPGIEQALAGRAGKSASVVGIEQAIETYRQQKAAVDAAIQQLIASGVSDQNEIAIRVADITQQLMAPFDELEARAKAGFSLDVSAFEQIGTALSNMNAGFTDFLPGVTSAREELISLSDQLMLTGQLSDEQAARLEYLASVAISVTENGSQLSNVIGDLGSEFLESNSFAAELVNQMVLAEAAYRNGAITGDIYAGIMAALSGKLLTVAQAAGIATGSIYALNQAQSDMASAGGLAIGGSIANRIQAQQGAQARDHNRRELERYNRDKARAEEQSAKRAGKVLEDGAKKASQELKAALDKVPGLFGTTQVTEQDMKDTELGIYVEKADEYLRRLRDEVKNGTDWADVSIGQAREGLVRAGLDPGVTEEQTLALLERAINDSSLFSAKENIPIFINEEAVKYAQDLQTKSEEGRKNIYEYFGVQVDEAVSAATGGGGAAIEVKPPDLIDVDPLTAGLQTGLDDVMVKTGEKMRQAVSSADVYSSDELKTMLYGTGQKSGATGKQIIGPLPKEIAITADPAVTNWLASTGAQGGTMQGPQPKLTPTIDTTGLQAELDKIELAASVHLAVTIEDIQLFRDTVTALVKPSVQVSLALATTAEGGQAQTPVAALVAQISTDIGANAATFATQGATVAQIIIAGMIASMKAQQSGEEGGETTPFATALAGKLSTELTTLQGTFYAVGFGPAQAVQDGFTGYNYADMGSGVLDAVTTSIRKDADNYKQRGGTIASYIQAGINEGFGSNLSFTYAMNSGAAWAQGFMAGALGAVGGGALAQAISDKVIKDIADEMEK